jgi:hypothetical protein
MNVLAVIAVLLLVPVAFMLCWNGGLSNVIDGVHNMDYVQAFLTTIIPVFLFGAGSSRN